MLKWFRLYNKYILAVGTAFLMIVFLLPAGFRRAGGGSPGKIVIGTVEGEEITLADQYRAASEVQIVQAVFSSVHPMLPQLVGSTTQKWMLMKFDARRMGLSAVDEQAMQLLAALGLTETGSVRNLTRRLDITEDALLNALANWIMLEQYKEVITGSMHTPVEERLNVYMALLAQVGQLQDLPPQFQQYYLSILFERLEQISRGRQRVSEPAIRRFLADQQAQVTIAAVPVSAQRYLDQIEPPAESAMLALFEKHKDNLPNAPGSEPHGFGYKLPDRVKIEFLSIPFHRVMALVSVSEADAVGYYDRNQSEFRNPPPSAETPGDEAQASPPLPPVKPYAAVRGQIINRLKRQEAEKLIRQMINTAQSILSEDARALSTQGGYRVVPEDWNPIPLADAAARIQKQFHLLPDTARLDDRWLDREALAQLAEIGDAVVPGNQRVPFVSYVMSARELAPDEALNPLATLRLQVKTPSVPLVGFDGSYFIFRLIEAEPSRRPHALDEVRPQVERDARLQAAYQLLLRERETWRQRIAAHRPEEVAAELGVMVIEPPSFPRRDMSTGVWQVPQIDQIGRSAEFVDAVFDLAHEFAEAGAIEQAPPEARTAAIPVDARLTIMLVSLKDHQAMPRSLYDQALNDPSITGFIHQAMLGDQMPEDLSEDAIAKRIGYVEKMN